MKLKIIKLSEIKLKKIFINLIVFIFLILLINSNLLSLEKLWIKDYYDPYSPKTESEILSRIKNGWYPAGFNFDGLDFSMIWLNKNIVNKLELPVRFTIKDFTIITIPDSEEGLNKILPQKLSNKFIPISISYYGDDFFIFAIEPKEKYSLQSYIISHFHKSEENKIAININSLIKKGYYPTGFSFYLDYYIFLSIKLKEINPSNNFYWGIDWVANHQTNINKYYESLFKNFFYPSDFTENTENLGILVLHK
ncbi:MAG: hypothetical protein ACK4YF_08520 [Exilispira sp.]